MFKRLRKYWERQKVFREIGSFDESGLVYAAEEGNRDCLAILIQAGFNVNAVSDRGVPAISRAVEKGNLPIIRMLVDAGADVDARDTQGLTPLMGSIRSSNRHIFSYLMEQDPDLELSDEAGETALFKAVRAGNTTLTRKLVEAGAEVEVINQSGCSPLMLAVENERIGVVKTLLNAGADPTIRDQRGRTVLEYDVQSPRLTRMLQKAAALKRQEHRGPSAESTAAKADSPLSGLLPNVGRNVFDQVPRLSSFMLSMMDTTLHALNSPYDVEDAEQKGRNLIQTLLGQRQADPANGHSPHGQNGHSHGKAYGKDLEGLSNQLQELMTWMRQQQELASTNPYLNGKAQAQLDRALLEASALGAHRIVPVLLNLGADHDARDDDGNTPLHLAVAHPAVIKQLLNDGADPGARNQSGQTPVDLARLGQQLATLEILPPQP
jgi:uncharacterized protein